MSKKLLTAKLSETQTEFLDVYRESNDIQLALEKSGLTKSNFNRDSVKDTPFGFQFRAAMNDTLKRYEFSKLSSINALVKIRDACLDDKDDYGMAISAIKEIAKMQNDHLAVVKRMEEHTHVNVSAVIDFSKPKELPEDETIDISYEEG